VSWQVVNLEEIEARTFSRGRLRGLNTALGVTGCGLSEIELPPHGSWVEHDECATEQEEVYLVTRGAGILRAGNDETPLRVGDVVVLSPDERRQVIAGADGLIYLAIGGPAGWYAMQ
jgi:quercetin dioxygenase-like cupin family protein